LEENANRARAMAFFCLRIDFRTSDHVFSVAKIVPVISLMQSELYARTRGLNWNTPLTKSSHDWNRLVCRSLHAILDVHSAFTETQVLGINDTEYGIQRGLPEKIGHDHEYVVSSEYRTMYNPEVTYRTAKGKNSRLVTERQLKATRQSSWTDRFESIENSGQSMTHDIETP
jgi:hypothetical protein